MKRSIRAIFISTILVFISACFMTGCNTAKGFGQDMQEGGQAIKKAANDSSN